MGGLGVLDMTVYGFASAAALVVWGSELRGLRIWASGFDANAILDHVTVSIGHERLAEAFCC